MFAARAGAARVYAVEQTSVAVFAQELAAANGVSEIVEVMHGDVADIEPPERVNVIVSEWLEGSGSTKGCSCRSSSPAIAGASLAGS